MTWRGQCVTELEWLISGDFSPQGVPIISLSFFLGKSSDDPWLWLDWLYGNCSLSLPRWVWCQTWIAPDPASLACSCVPSPSSAPELQPRPPQMSGHICFPLLGSLWNGRGSLASRPLNFEIQFFAFNFLVPLRFHWTPWYNGCLYKTIILGITHLTKFYISDQQSGIYLFIIYFAGKSGEIWWSQMLSLRWSGDQVIRWSPSLLLPDCVKLLISSSPPLWNVPWSSTYPFTHSCTPPFSYHSSSQPASQLSFPQMFTEHLLYTRCYSNHHK